MRVALCGEYAKGLGRSASAGSGRDAGHRLLPFKRLGRRDADAPRRLPQLPGLHFPHRIYVEGRSERRSPAGGILRGAEESGLSRLFSDDLRIPQSPAHDLLFHLQSRFEFLYFSNFGAKFQTFFLNRKSIFVCWNLSCSSSTTCPARSSSPCRCC